MKSAFLCRGLASLLLCFGLAPSSFAQEDAQQEKEELIKGTSLIAEMPGNADWDDFFTLIPLEMTLEEWYWFRDLKPVIEAWVRVNQESWIREGQRGDYLQAVRDFELWSTLNIDPNAYFAFFTRSAFLMAIGELNKTSMDSIEDSITEHQAILARPGATEAELTNSQARLDEFQRQLILIKGTPQSNREFYSNKAEAINDFYWWHKALATEDLSRKPPLAIELPRLGVRIFSSGDWWSYKQDSTSANLRLASSKYVFVVNIRSWEPGEEIDQAALERMKARYGDDAKILEESLFEDASGNTGSDMKFYFQNDNSLLSLRLIEVGGTLYTLYFYYDPEVAPQVEILQREILEFIELGDIARPTLFDFPDQGYKVLGTGPWIFEDQDHANVQTFRFGQTSLNVEIEPLNSHDFPALNSTILWQYYQESKPDFHWVQFHKLDTELHRGYRSGFYESTGVAAGQKRAHRSRHMVTIVDSWTYLISMEARRDDWEALLPAAEAFVQGMRFQPLGDGRSQEAERR